MSTPKHWQRLINVGRYSAERDTDVMYFRLFWEAICIVRVKLTGSPKRMARPAHWLLIFGPFVWENTPYLLWRDEP